MNNFVVAITRTCGSGGMSIGKLLSDYYAIDIYDRKLLQLASEDSGISEELFASVDESMKKSMLYRVSRKVYTGELIPPESDDFTSNANLFAYQAKVLKELAERESYVVIGRAADYVLKDFKNLIRVYIHAPKELCIEREMKRQGINRREAAAYVEKMDKYREAYYTYHTGREWKSADNFDLCLDTSKFSYEEAAEMIKSMIRIRTGNTL
ncbi:MAG: cytidylate kinase-like family protein [Lachnospiraceae bacterium]|nr:cytidylate kinase-like family protein [Oscillospiraceae bacterium]MDY5647924.1 cytidylate kinase-like family protein [Lachnospiraceae bacterium]